MRRTRTSWIARLWPALDATAPEFLVKTWIGEPCVTPSRLAVVRGRPAAECDGVRDVLPLAFRDEAHVERVAACARRDHVGLFGLGALAPLVLDARDAVVPERTGLADVLDDGTFPVLGE